MSKAYYLSAYALAVKHGFQGSEEEWLAALHGIDGKSAYEYAKDGGFEGTEEDFAARLMGELLSKVSELENDAGYITKAAADLENYYRKSEVYTQEEVKALVSAIPKFGISVVSALPTEGISETTVYLVSGGEGSDLYTEYIYVSGKWEILGSQKIDLSGYAKKEDLPEKLPNPHALIIGGCSYDGSAAVTLYIGSGKSVKACGAKGDGVTDDTAAFQKALAAERVVSVPGGTYVLSGELVIRENCCLELSQDTVLKFTQTDANCITLLRLASLRGNHATIFVPYTFGAKVLNCDTAEDEAALGTDDLANANATAVPPFTRWDPQWKMSRYVTDINICKPNANGFHYSDDGTCCGTAVYMGCSEGVADFMWGVSMSGLRIAGGFVSGIHMACEGATWNHDMRIEAVIDACETSVLVENTHYARLAVTIQARPAADGTTYAKHGIKLVVSRGIDLSSCRVWDWNANNTLWTEGGEYQHIAMYGQCRGLILDDFFYHEVSADIRDLIYTDTASNLEQMTILQEPITRWFKPVDGEPYFFDGYDTKRLAMQEDIAEYFQTDRIQDYTDVKSPYQDGVWDNNGTLTAVASSIYIEPREFSVGDVVRIRGIDFTTNYPGKAFAYLYDKSSGAYKGVNNLAALIASSATGTTANGEATYEWNNETKTLTYAFNGQSAESLCEAFLFAFGGGYASGYDAESVIMTVNEEIAFTQAGFLSDGIKVKAENVVGDVGGSSTWELIGEVTSDGTGTSVGIGVEVDFTAYKQVYAEAVDDANSAITYRIVLSSSMTAWSNGAVIKSNARSEKVLHTVRINNIDGDLKILYSANSGYGGGTVSAFSYNNPRASMPATTYKYIRMDTANNADYQAVPEGCTLKVWGLK